MNDTKKTIKYLAENKNDKLISLIKDYIYKVKTLLHEDNFEYKYDEGINLVNESGRIVTTIKEQSEDSYLFYAGYLAALTEEFELHAEVRKNWFWDSRLKKEYVIKIPIPPGVTI